MPKRPASEVGCKRTPLSLGKRMKPLYHEFVFERCAIIPSKNLNCQNRLFAKREGIGIWLSLLRFAINVISGGCGGFRQIKLGIKIHFICLVRRSACFRRSTVLSRESY